MWLSFGTWWLRPQEGFKAGGNPSEGPVFAEKSWLGTEELLVVDDDPLVLRHAARSLASRGYRVSTAMSANEALEVLENNPGVVLLLTDVLMPEMSGRALADRARQQKPDLKVVYMSGYDFDIVAVQGVVPDGLNFIQKPFREAGLCMRIRAVLDQPKA